MNKKPFPIIGIKSKFHSSEQTKNCKFSYFIIIVAVNLDFGLGLGNINDQSNKLNIFIIKLTNYTDNTV